LGEVPLAVVEVSDVGPQLNRLGDVLLADVFARAVLVPLAALSLRRPRRGGGAGRGRIGEPAERIEAHPVRDAAGARERVQRPRARRRGDAYEGQSSDEG